MLLGWSREGREQATGQMAEACGCMCIGDGVCKELTAGPLETAQSNVSEHSLLNDTSADFMERKREGRWR